jgi:hypothetical protein
VVFGLRGPLPNSKPVNCSSMSLTILAERGITTGWLGIVEYLLPLLRGGLALVALCEGSGTDAVTFDVLNCSCSNL